MSQKLQRVVYTKQKQIKSSQTIVIGVCDYLPSPLSFSSGLTIWLKGQLKPIINHVLWNKNYSKTLLRDCYHAIYDNLAELSNHNHRIFIKFNQFVDVLNDVMEWNSSFMQKLMNFKGHHLYITIECLSKTGLVRKIYLNIGMYPPKNQADIKFIMNSQNSNPKTDSESILRQTNRSITKAKTNSSSKFNTISSAIKPKKKQKENSYSKKQLMNHFKFSTNKQQKANTIEPPLINKQNNKNLLRLLQSNSNSTTGQTQVQPRLHDSLPSKIKGPELVLSKIITAKDEALAILKVKTKKQQEQYEKLIKSQQYTHEQEMQTLNTNLKQVLEEYGKTCTDQHNEIKYLKQRITLLEESLKNRQNLIESNLQQAFTIKSQKRTLQQLNKRYQAKYIQQKNQSQAQVKHLLLQQNRINDELIQWMNKANQYKTKYQTVIQTMKKIIPLE